MRKAVHTSLVVAVLCGAVLMVVGECLAGPLLRWMDTPENIIHLARQYLQIYLLGAIFQMVYNFEAAILRANGDTRRPLLCLLLSGGVNVVLNLVFVLLFHMDVAGVALATVIADGVGAGLLWHYLRRGDRADPGGARLAAPGQEAAAGHPVYWHPGGHSGDDVQHCQCDHPVGDQPAGLGCGGGLHHWRNCGDLCLLSAQQLWPGQHDLQRPELRGGESAPVPECHPLVPAAGGILSEAFALLLVVFGLPFAGIYTSDAGIALLALTRMRWVLPFQLFNMVIEVMSGTLRGLGYSFVPTILCAVFVCGLRILWVAFVFPLMPTFQGLLLVYPASWLAAGAAVTVAYWALKRKLLTEKPPQAPVVP